MEGGCSNDYAYVHGDPINSYDLDGRYTCDGKWHRQTENRNRVVGRWLGSTYTGPGQGGVVKHRYVTYDFTQYRCTPVADRRRRRAVSYVIEFREVHVEQLQAYVGYEFGPFKGGRIQSASKYTYGSPYQNTSGRA